MNQDDHSDLSVGGDQDGSNLFTGRLDDLRLFLWGDNSGTTGPNGQQGADWGDFQLAHR